MSSMLIRGMEMPQKCGQCKLFHAEHPMHCMAVEGYRTVGAPYGMPRPDWCPLVEIPPHGRLIDIDDAIESYGERAELGYVSQSKFLNVVIQAEGERGMTDKEILDELEQTMSEIREIKSGLASAMKKLDSIHTNLKIRQEGSE